MGMFRSKDSLPVVPRQAAATARPCYSPDTLCGMETWQGFRLLAASPKTSLSAGCAAGRLCSRHTALAESNLKGFANTSVVLIETNTHQAES